MGGTFGRGEDGVTASGVCVGEGDNVGGACLGDGDIGADDVCAALEGGSEAFGIMFIFGGVSACAHDQVGADGGLDLGFVAEGGIDFDDGSERIVGFSGDKTQAVLLCRIVFGVGIALFATDEQDEENLATDFSEGWPSVFLEGGLEGGVFFAEIVRGKESFARKDRKDGRFEALVIEIPSVGWRRFFGFEEDKDREVGGMFARPSVDLGEAVCEERASAVGVESGDVEDIKAFVFGGPIEVEFKLSYALLVELFGERGVGVVPRFDAVVGGDVVAVVGAFDLDVVEAELIVESRRGGGGAGWEEKQEEKGAERMRVETEKRASVFGVVIGLLRVVLCAKRRKTAHDRVLHAAM